MWLAPPSGAHRAGVRSQGVVACIANATLDGEVSDNVSQSTAMRIYAARCSERAGGCAMTALHPNSALNVVCEASTASSVSLICPISTQGASAAKARRDQDLREYDLDPVDLSLPPGDIKRCLHRYTYEMLPIGPHGPAGAGRYGSVI